MAPPGASVLNYAFIAGAGLNIANGITVPICDPSEAGQPCPNDFRVLADVNATHLVADVLGFFERFPSEELSVIHTASASSVGHFAVVASCSSGGTILGGGCHDTGSTPDGGCGNTGLVSSFRTPEPRGAASAARSRPSVSAR